MQATVPNTLEQNRQGLDNLYLDTVVKLPERIDHVETLVSIGKLGYKPIHVSAVILIFFQNHVEVMRY